MSRTSGATSGLLSSIAMNWCMPVRLPDVIRGRCADLASSAWQTAVISECAFVGIWVIAPIFLFVCFRIRLSTVHGKCERLAVSAFCERVSQNIPWGPGVPWQQLAALTSEKGAPATVLRFPGDGRKWLPRQRNGRGRPNAPSPWRSFVRGALGIMRDTKPSEVAPFPGLPPAQHGSISLHDCTHDQNLLPSSCGMPRCICLLPPPGLPAARHDAPEKNHANVKPVDHAICFA